MLQAGSTTPFSHPAKQAEMKARVVVRALEEHYRACQGKECDLVFVRKLGVATACLVSARAEVLFESGARVVARTPLSDVIDELSARL